MYLFPPSPHNWPEAGATVVMSQRLWWPRLRQYRGSICDILPNPGHHHSDTPHITVSTPVSHGDTSRCQCQVSDGRKYGRGHLLQSEPEAARQDITRGMPSVWLCLWIYVLWYFVDKRNQLNNNEQKFFTRFAALCEMASWLTFWVSGSSNESLRIWKIKKCCNYKKVFLATRRCNFTVKMELCAKRIITISRIACDFDITKVCSELHFAASAAGK